MLHGYLRQSTAAQSRLVGPFLDDTDFKTPKTGLTIANTDIKLSANGAAGANKNSGGGTHRNNGMYALTFDATDTATVGELGGSIVVAGALPVVFKFLVLTAAIYDALYASGALGFLQPTIAGRTLDVTATGEAAIDLGNVGAPAGNSALELGILWAGTVAAISATSMTLPGGHNLDHEGNYAIVLTGGTGALGKSRYLTYSGASEVWTVDPAWDSDGETVPSGTITALIVSAPKLPTAGLPTVNVAAAGLDAVLDSADVVETAFSLRGYFRATAAALLGRESGRGTSTTVFRNAVANSKTRITSVRDSSHNRATVTIDQT